MRTHAWIYVFAVGMILLLTPETKGSIVITTTGDFVFFNTTTRGVDIRSCTVLPVQIKACDQAHVWLGDGTPTGSYEIGTWTRGESGLRQCSECFATEVFYTNPIGISCNDFRWFWFKWGNGRFAMGEGPVPGELVVFDVPSTRTIHTFNVGSYFYNVDFKLGEGYEDRYLLAGTAGRFSDGLIQQQSSRSYLDCATVCHRTDDCGHFSHNVQLEQCALYNKGTSSFSLTSETGWKSWKLRYCD